MEPTTRSFALQDNAAVVLPDDELVAGIVAEQETALGAIYQRYNRLVYSIALRITKDHMVAEEVVQDVFHSVWQAAATFRPNSSLAAWLIGITRHRAIDATRSRSFRSRGREETLDDLRLGITSADQPDALLHQEALLTALACLTPKQRQGIDLAYFSGLTHVEIAARLGKPVGTVKSRIHLGLERLRTLMVGLEEELAY